MGLIPNASDMAEHILVETLSLERKTENVLREAKEEARKASKRWNYS